MIGCETCSTIIIDTTIKTTKGDSEGSGVYAEAAKCVMEHLLFGGKA